MAQFEHAFTVQPDDIDRQGHVNNVRYVQWIQDAAVAHWQATATAAHLASVTWVVLRHEVDYLRPAFADEAITVRTWVSEMNGVRCERFTEIQRGEEILVKAKSIWCALDAQTLRPRRIDAQLKEIFGTQ